MGERSPALNPRRWAVRCEWIAAALLFAALLALRIIGPYRYRFNSDEPQHLHILWGWTRGLVQYRDLFDNHPPLFHLLMAPIFALFPERADIVISMRLTMIPLYVASLAAIYRLGRALYSPRAGVWLALLGGVLPWFFLPFIEFRPDDLYAALWFWMLVVLVEGRLNTARMAVAGLLIGICAGITLKTLLAGVSLVFAAAIALAVRRWRPSLRESVPRVSAFGVCCLIAPALLLVFFARLHALPQLYYCVFKHNVVPGEKRWSGPVLHYFYLPAALPLLIFAAIWISKKAPNPETGARRVLITLVPLLYGLFLWSYWPDITEQDTLPWVPLLPCAAMPLIEICARRLPVWSAFLPPLAVAATIPFLFAHDGLASRSVEKYVQPIAAALQLTKPGEYVMDLKGDAIYRPRPFYYVIETFTKARMRLGWIRNDIVADLVATRTTVCMHPPFPGDATMRFVRSNYLPLASQPNVLVLGRKLTNGQDGTEAFTVAIPAEYVLLRGDSPVPGTLDGTPCNGPRELSAGVHHFLPAATDHAEVFLYLAGAWRMHYLPAE